jgi:hypothetical protein
VEKEVTRETKDVRQSPAGPKPKRGREGVNGKPSGTRTASDEQFRKAHRKTSTLHAGLFRRLAE